MNTEQRELYLSEAVNIGEEIINSAIKEGQEWHWNTKNHEGVWKHRSDFYAGSAGIIYFLIELYEITNEKKYRDGVVFGCNKLIKDKNEKKDLNIYCGLGGIIYVLLRAYKISSNESYKTYALQVTKDCMHSKSLNNRADLLTGVAGSILTLLHLHNDTKENWLLKEIFEYVDILLDSAVLTKQGISWDRDGTSIHPLCGFSHGSSGIAFLFLELHRYFNNKFFLIVAELAFEYEDKYFLKESEIIYRKNNWPDFRKDTTTEESLKKGIDSYLMDDMNYFTQASSMSAWCHGAPGIGMARLHAFKVTGVERHLEYFKSAMLHTLNSFNYKTRNYTLCHGVLGNANLLLDYYSYSNNIQFYLKAQMEANNCLVDKKKYGYYLSGYPKVNEADCGLLMGTAGIGHFFLRLVNTNTNSVLLPKLENISNSIKVDDRYNSVYFSNYMLRKLFPNSFLIFKEVDLINEIDVPKIRNEIRTKYSIVVREQNNRMLSYAYDLDIFKLDLSDSIESDYYLFIKDQFNKSEIIDYNFEKLSFEEIFNFRLKRNSNVSFKLFMSDKYTLYTLLFISYRGEQIQQYTISEYTYDMLTTFNDANAIGDSYAILLKKYSALYNVGNFKSIFRNGITNCLKMTFLHISSDKRDNTPTNHSQAI